MTELEIAELALKTLIGQKKANDKSWEKFNKKMDKKETLLAKQISELNTNILNLKSAEDVVTER